MRAVVLASCVHCCILSAWKQCLVPEGVRFVHLMQIFPARASNYLDQFTVILPCCPLPPFLVIYSGYPGIKAWGNVNASFCLALHMQIAITYFSCQFFANLPFLLLPNPYFFKPSSISFHSLHLQAFKFPFRMPLHPHLQNEIQSVKPGIQFCTWFQKHFPSFCFLYVRKLISNLCLQIWK